jgi:hypothetical protein
MNAKTKEQFLLYRPIVAESRQRKTLARSNLWRIALSPFLSPRDAVQRVAEEFLYPSPSGGNQKSTGFAGDQTTRSGGPCSCAEANQGMPKVRYRG